MRIVAVVGGIAAGKTTVCQMLEGFGGKRVDADSLGHKALRQKQVREALLRHFGPGILRADGEIDRRRLGCRVFGKPRQLATLNAIVHPAIGRAIRRQLCRMEGRGVPFALIDAALFLDTDLGIRADAIIAVTAPKRVRRRRLAVRENLSVAEIDKRLDSQPALRRWTVAADFRIDTQGSLEKLRGRVAELWGVLQPWLMGGSQSGEKRGEDGRTE